MKKRTEPDGRKSVLDRMNYADSSIVSQWKSRFPAQSVKTEKTVKTTRRTAPKVETVNEPKPTSAPAVRSVPTSIVVRREDSFIDFERLSFVCKALSKDVTRLYGSIVHVEQAGKQSLLLATDGHRLHAAKLNRSIPVGDYKPLITKGAVTLTPEPDIQFPNWKAVIPTKVTRVCVLDLEDTGLGKNESQTQRMALALSAFFRDTGETVNLRYLDDLSKKVWVVYGQKEKGKTLLFKEKDAEEEVFAVIVPLMPEVVASAVMAKAA
jgi:hypothetical protein